MEHYQDALHTRITDAISHATAADLPLAEYEDAAQAVIDVLGLVEERRPTYPPGRRQDGPFLRPGTTPDGYEWRAVGGWVRVPL